MTEALKGPRLANPAPRPPVETTPAFHRYGPDIPQNPVILSIPHAGRAYTGALLATARVGLDVLRRLEDRWADCLAHDLVDRGFSVLVAQTPRACIDLNRHEREIDPVMVTGIPPGASLQASLKLRGGLGLIPRRMPGANELWRTLLPWAEVQRRIVSIHRPYHAALARLMQSAREEHGHAILIDLHSMPPLPPASAGKAAPGIVLGDRFGRSASTRLMTLAADVAAGHGIVTALNHPYAGDHMIERHGRPAHAMHALQLEVDRSLYLDAALDGPGPGLPGAQAIVSAIAEALAQELPRASIALAAE